MSGYQNLQGKSGKKGFDNSLLQIPISNGFFYRPLACGHGTNVLTVKGF